MSKLQFDYYYGDESEQFSFIRIPKQLFQNNIFAHISDRAKILYGLMLDRMSLSRSNNWVDEQNRVFIIYTVEELCKDLNCSGPAITTARKELNTKEGLGLIEIKKRGQGKPDLIYVKNFISFAEDASNNAPDTMVSSKNALKKESKEKNENCTNIKKSKNLISRNNFSNFQEIKEFSPNNTKENNTKANNTSNHISSEESNVHKTKTDMTSYEPANEDISPIIVLDPSKRLLDGDVFDIQSTIDDLGEIPFEWAIDADKMQLCLQTLSGWNDLLDGADGFSENDLNVYLVMLKNLIEMACATKPIKIGEHKSVTYKHVFEQLNKILHTSKHPELCLMDYMHRCIERYQNAYKKVKIQKVDAYCKAVLWSTFDSYEVDWDGYFAYTYNQSLGG